MKNRIKFHPLINAFLQHIQQNPNCFKNQVTKTINRALYSRNFIEPDIQAICTSEFSRFLRAAGYTHELPLSAHCARDGVG